MGKPKLRSSAGLVSNTTITITVGALMRLPLTVTPANLGNGLIFVGLNIADAWVTKQLLAHGGGEANSIASAYASSMLAKGFLALAIVLILIRLDKVKLLKVLNMCMVAVVVWTGGWVLTYL